MLPVVEDTAMIDSYASSLYCFTDILPRSSNDYNVFILPWVEDSGMSSSAWRTMQMNNAYLCTL